MMETLELNIYGVGVVFLTKFKSGDHYAGSVDNKEQYYYNYNESYTPQLIPLPYESLSKRFKIKHLESIKRFNEEHARELVRFNKSKGYRGNNGYYDNAIDAFKSIVTSKGGDISSHLEIFKVIKK